MANGIIAQTYITATGSAQLVHTVPSSVTASFSVHICNQAATDAKISVALTTSGTPTNLSYIEFQVPVYAKESFKITGLILTAGQSLYVTTDTSNISVNIYGFEQ